MNASWRSLLVLIVFSADVYAQIPLVQPLAGTNNVDWTIANYVDVDSSSGRRDYTGAIGDNSFTYNGHGGIDFTLPNFAAMDRGVPVYAAAAGTVSFSRDINFDRCTNDCGGDEVNFIRITHTSGYETVYYHLARNSALVREGDSVAAGQQIGLVGSSGNSSDAHLHFEVHRNGTIIETYQNPAQFWSNPLPYAGIGMRAIDTGFTRQEPTIPQLRERPADNNVVYQSDGASQQITYWAQVHSIADQAFTYVLRNPNNVVWESQTLSSETKPWGWTFKTFTLPSSPDVGEWTASVWVGSTMLRADKFTVVAAPESDYWVAPGSPSPFTDVWHTPSNWWSNTVPGPGEQVRLAHSDGAERNVYYQQSNGPTLKSLVVDLTGPGSNRFTFSNGSNDIDLMDALYVGEYGRATFNQTGGRITTANPNFDAVVGWQNGSDGVYNMSSNSALHVARDLYVAANAFSRGTFNQQNGTTTSAGDVHLGNGLAAWGVYNLSGGTLNVGDVLYVGGVGDGELYVSGRSQVITRNGTTLGYDAGSRGIVTIDGGRAFWDTDPDGLGQTIVGREGTGTLHIRNNAFVNHNYAILGDSSSGTGTVNVSGVGRWKLKSGLTVGEAGIGTLTIRTAGSVAADSVVVGADAGSQGTIVIDNDFSRLDVTGDISIGSAGTGSVTVTGYGALVANRIIVGNGRLTVSNGGVAFGNGVLGGITVGTNGTLDGDSVVGNFVSNNGAVSPGTSPSAPSTLLVSGNYSQSFLGTLKITLASANTYSRLTATGTISVDGTLNVSTNGFTPAAGQLFEIMNATSISGAFDNILLPTLVSGLTWNISQLYTAGIISVDGSTGLPGDYTQNGKVDAADYIIWRNTSGTQSGYQTWRANYGRTVSGVGSANVPEPAASSVCLLCIAFFARACKVRR